MTATYEAIFALIDRTAAPILKMEENFRHLGEVGADANRKMTPHEKLFSHLSKDMDEFGERFGKMSESATEFGSRLGEVLGPLAAFGAVGSVAGIVEMTHRFEESTEQLGILAKISGTTIQMMQGLNFVALQTGVSTDGLARGMEMLNKNIGAAGAGKNKAVVTLLDQLHISLRDSHGVMLNAASALPKLADAFAATKDPAQQAFMATTLFGRAGLQLLPMLDQGSKGIQKFLDMYQKYGYTVSSQDTEGLEAFGNSWKNMQTAVSGLTDEISAKLAPVMAPIIQMVADWTAKNRSWIATGLAQSLKSVGDSLKDIDFKGIITSMDDFGTETLNVVNDLGGLKTVMIGAGGIMAASFLAPVVELTTAFGKLALSMGVPVVKAIFGVGASMIEVIPMVKGFKDVWVALDLIMDANPFGVAILGAAAFGAVAYELWKHWDTVSKDLSKTFKFIGSEFDKVFQPIEKVLTDVNNEMSNLFGPAGGSGPGTADANNPNITHTSGGYWERSMHGEVFIHFANAPPGTTMTVKNTPGGMKIKPGLGHSSMATGTAGR